MQALKDDTSSISALHLAIKVPYFSNSGHKNEKVTPLTVTRPLEPSLDSRWSPRGADTVAFDPTSCRALETWQPDVGETFGPTRAGTDHEADWTLRKTEGIAATQR
eukprot:SAG31_NODE_569_length_14020_cov_11.049565_15_plen_106_part_00